MHLHVNFSSLSFVPNFISPPEWQDVYFTSMQVCLFLAFGTWLSHAVVFRGAVTITAEEPSYPQSSSNQSKSKMATSMINLVHRANFSRLLRPAVRLGQFYSTSTTPTVVDKQDKALEVIDEDGKVKNLN